MKLSLEWLKQYVDIPHLTPEKIAHRLTMATAEVEGVEVIRRSVKGIMVGEITAIEAIDTGESGRIMNYVTVNTGTDSFKTVCGAPNVKIGMKSAFAAPGISIADGFIVRELEVYGRMSCGILCSPKELGWGEFHVGIMAFSDDLDIGTELAEIVPPEDHIFDIDNKTITHRPDLWGHYGFARELAAILSVELKPLETADASAWETLDAFPLEILDSESCPGYCCLDIDGLEPAFSPINIQYLLLAIGLRPINLLVDFTNFIMCELGQPMHAFDGERVRDILVKPFGSDGTFITLDSIERSMKPEDLMICDNTGPIALAGIMGGEESEINEDTSRILLESANFNPARIRRTSLRLNLRSDASMRFEKGQPLYHMALSIKRFIQLLQDAGQKPVLCSKLTCGGNTGEEIRSINMKTEMINRSIGINIPDEKIITILESLGFGCDLKNGELLLKIPPYRSKRDISIPNDIIEEVARIYGYDNITPSMPEVEMRPYAFNIQLQKQHKIRRYLSSAKGFSEVHTYSWYDNNWLKLIGYNPEETLKLKNPTADNNTQMRLELMPNLLMLVESNVMHRDSLFLYEVGNVYHPSKDGCDQFLHLAGVAYQSEKIGNIQNLFLSIKGTVEEIFALTNAGTPVFSNQKSSLKPWHIPDATMDIFFNDELSGHMGYLTEKKLKVYDKGTHIVWLELNVDILTGQTYPVIGYDEIPVYPGSWMDFSILADTSSTYAALDETFEEFSHPIIRKKKFLYLYDGSGLPQGKASYTFRFWLGLKERTLTGEDLSDFHDSFLGFLEKRGLSLR